MKSNAKPFLIAGFVSVAGFLSVNAISLFFSFLMLENRESFRINFNNGSFYLNDKVTGLVWGESSAIVFLSIVFFTVFFWVRNAKTETKG